MAKGKKKASEEPARAASRLQHLFKVTCTFRYAVQCTSDEITRMTLDVSGLAPEVVDVELAEGVLYPREVIRSAAGSLGFPCLVEEEPHIATLKQALQDEDGSPSYLMRVQCTVDFFVTFSDRETGTSVEMFGEPELTPRPRPLRAFTKGIEAGMQQYLPMVLIHNETSTEHMGTTAPGKPFDPGEPRMLMMMKPGFYSED